MKPVLVLVLVLGLGCKTDDTPKASSPSPSPPSPRTAPTPPATPAPPPPAEPPPVEPAPTKSQKALAIRMEAIGKVAITAKKHQGDCKGLSEAVAALARDVRATASVRADLDEADAAIDRRQMAKALSMVLSASKGCETAAFDPLTDQLSESASSK